MEINEGGGNLYLAHLPDLSTVSVVRERDTDHVRIVIESSTPGADMSMSVPLSPGEARDLGEQLMAHATLMEGSDGEKE